MPRGMGCHLHCEEERSSVDLILPMDGYGARLFGLVRCLSRNMAGKGSGCVCLLGNGWALGLSGVSIYRHLSVETRFCLACRTCSEIARSSKSTRLAIDAGI